VSYTIKNLRDTKDSAPEFGLAETQEAHFPAPELGAKTTGLAFHVIRPGRRQGFAHRHEDAEEIYVVLAGTGKIKLDEKTVDIGPLDAIRVAPAVTRAFEAGPGRMELIAFGPRHEGDGEILRDGFWDD
jgi:mannose-6-phosphate isomerase-like protein (cupin superfamily)